MSNGPSLLATAVPDAQAAPTSSAAAPRVIPARAAQRGGTARTHRAMHAPAAPPTATVVTSAQTQTPELRGVR